ncbi:MAG: LytTR family DNA-binding domain-containing protein [Candidatus Pseudobacter hemicellulosilyticus]|uniref:LytTR family DNA-binding domain-containing protein n=1 Tax=Candidatus Pseudobacter hemicellulosilyticus TaxID=3121375 RepID=A0AAJ5WND2_9BACT|nr:MAG: LytTR family DNA-binding domain-containing protein [Pseudobacter sp.]
MKIVIIEDERLTAADLAETISRLQPGAEIIAQPGSVQEAIQFFRQGIRADLIFSDIQLGDGLAFELFNEIPFPAPVIFCTAFDQYALKAFGANGIDYILKPFTDQSVRGALDKFQALKEKFADNPRDYRDILQLFQERKPAGDGSVLVYHKDKILPVPFRSIAFFQLRNALVHLTTFDQKSYQLSKPLEELEKQAGTSFYRVNRQFLVNRQAIVEASNYLSRKIAISLCVKTPEVITVSKEKVPGFLEWLSRS